MPSFVNIPTELTTAGTDALLALIALCLALLLTRSGRSGFYSRLWQSLFFSLAIASFLGAVAHGIAMKPLINHLLWHPIYFFLGMTLTLLAVVAIHDNWGGAAASSLLPWLLPAPFLVVLVTWIASGEFLIFILFEVTVMLVVLVIYIRLAIIGRAGAVLILVGIVLSIIAAMIQSVGPFTVRLIWLFDHNGIFHLVQMPGLYSFYAGAIKSLSSGSD